MPQQRSYLPAIDSIVRLNGGTPTTTSLIIAEKFSKRHRDVLRQISVIVNHPGYTEISERNFAPANYIDQQGKSRPYYEITRDGFTLLAMSFTGHEAMRFKLRFIDAFNRLERDMLERLPQLEAENHALRYALLTRNPRWSAIVRYQCMGLKQVEIAKLLGLSASTVRGEQREMEALGVVTRGEHPQLSLLAGGES